MNMHLLSTKQSTGSTLQMPVKVGIISPSWLHSVSTCQLLSTLSPRHFQRVNGPFSISTWHMLHTIWT